MVRRLKYPLSGGVGGVMDKNGVVLPTEEGSSGL